MALLTIENLHLRYRGQTRDAIDGVSFQLEQGEIFALLGPSGSGKTSTLRAIAGFERPKSGLISLGGRVLSGDGAFTAPEHRHIGFVFQDFALFPHLTVLENVTFGLHGLDHDERLRRALGMGASRPWPDALEALTGQRQMDASAIADYFAPLKTWLDEQNRGRPIGW